MRGWEIPASCETLKSWTEWDCYVKHPLLICQESNSRVWYIEEILPFLHKLNPGVRMGVSRKLPHLWRRKNPGNDKFLTQKEKSSVWGFVFCYTQQHVNVVVLIVTKPNISQGQNEELGVEIHKELARLNNYNNAPDCCSHVLPLHLSHRAKHSIKCYVLWLWKTELVL